MAKIIKILKINKIYIIVFCGFFLIWAYCLYTFNTSKIAFLKEIDQRLYQAAMGTKFLLNDYPELVPSSIPIDPDLYDSLSYELSEFAKKSKVDYVYSLDRYHQQVVFTVSSYSEQDLKNNQSIQYLTPYLNASEQLTASFNKFESFYENTTDQSGSFRSILLPVINERGNPRLVGAKIQLSQVETAINNSMIQAITTAGYFLIFSLVFGSVYVHRMRNGLLRDPATGFSNHLALNERLKDKEKHSLVAVIGCADLADIEGFYGQNVLDDCVKSILESTSKKLGKYYTCYRLSYNRVVVVADSIVNQEQMDWALSSLNDTTLLLMKPVIYAQLQVGSAYGNNKNVLENAMLAEATARAKKVPVYGYSDVAKDLKHRYQENALMSGLITDAFKENRFVPYFQPIVDTKTGKAVKYEALARLVENDGSIIAPYKFLPVISRSRLDQELVKAMFNRCRDKFSDTDICWSINMSVRDMIDPKLSRWLIHELKRYPNPSNITLELLETQEIDNYAQIQLFIDQYRNLGAKIFIDDFGVGYSNISHFLKLDIDGIKLDGSLIERISEDKCIHLFIKYIIEFANAIGIEVVAEYIENEEVLATMKSLGAHMVQGYYFSPPTPHIFELTYPVDGLTALENRPHQITNIII